MHFSMQHVKLSDSKPDLSALSAVSEHFTTGHARKVYDTQG